MADRQLGSFRFVVRRNGVATKPLALGGARQPSFDELLFMDRVAHFEEFDILLLGGFGLLSLWRGFSDAGAPNSVRVFKSLGFSLLFVPLLRHEVADSGAFASQRLASGMVAGLTVVTLTVLWERAAFPGLLNFSSHYRTVALFWEMHVGGAAIDDYLALSTPFVAWALFSARRPMAWTAPCWP